MAQAGSGWFVPGFWAVVGGILRPGRAKAAWVRINFVTAF